MGSLRLRGPSPGMSPVLRSHSGLTEWFPRGPRERWEMRSRAVLGGQSQRLHHYHLVPLRRGGSRREEGHFPFDSVDLALPGVFQGDQKSL